MRVAAFVVFVCAGCLSLAQAQNNNPTFGRGPDITVDQNSGTYSGTYAATPWPASGPDDGDGGTQSLSFTMTARTPQLFSRQPTMTPAGLIDFRPANGQTGTSLVDVFLKDDGVTSCGTCTCSPSDCSRSVMHTFRIQVRFVNQRPSFENAGDVSVAMNTGTTTISNWAFNMQRGPDNADENIQTLTWSISAPTVGTLFRQAPTISPQGHLKFEPAPDQFGFDTFTVTLQDNGGTANGGVDTSVSYTLRIDVTFVNSPPFFTPGPDRIQVDEDTGAGWRAWATGIDPGNPGETSQSVRFVLEWQNAGCADIFARQPTMDPTGNLTWELLPNMDTIQFSCKMRVQLQDDHPSDPKNSCPMNTCGTIEFIVLPINDAPFFVPGPNISVWEDLKNEVTPPGVPAAGAVVNWVRLSTPGNDHERDAHGQTVRYVVEPDNPDLFHVLPTIDATGTLRYTLAAHTNGRTTMTVTIFDSEDMQGNTEIVTIEVLSSNNAPVFDYAVATPIRVPQDCEPQTIPVFLRNVNPAPGQALDEFNVQDMTIQAGTPSRPEIFQVIPSVQFSGENSASLRFTCKPGMSGSSNQTITLADDGGTFRRGEDRTVREFEIIIVPNIVPPSYTFENQIVEVVQGQCDAGCSFSNFAMNIKSGNPNADSQVTFGVITAVSSLFAEPPTISSSGALSFKTTLNTNGRSATTVTATSTESGQTTPTGQVFTIVVLPKNTAPYFAKGASFTGTNAVAECRDRAAGCVHSFANWATGIRKGAAGSTQEDDQRLTFRATVPEAQRGLFTDSGIRIDATTGTLSFTLRNNGGNTGGSSFTVPIVLVDDGGTSYGGIDSFSTSVEMSIAVFKVPPSAVVMPSVSVYQGSERTLISNFLTGVAPGYVPAGSSALSVLSVAVSASDATAFTVLPSAQFTSDTAASLSFEVAPFVAGQYSLTVTLSNSDSSKNFVGTATLLIVAYNHAPTFTLVSPTVAVDKNTGTTTAQIVRDISAGPGTENSLQTVSFSIACGSLNLFSTAPTVSRSGTLSFTPATDAVGTASCVLVAKDNGGTSTRPIAGVEAPVSRDTSTESPLTITIRAVHSAPSFSASTVVPAVQGQGLVAVANFATAIDTGNPAARAVNQTNAVDFVFDVACSTVNAPSESLFTVAPTVGSATGALTFATASGVSGSISCTAVLRHLRAVDSSLAASATHRFTINVAHVNTKPSFAAATATIVTSYNSSQTVQRYPAWATAISGGDANPSLSFTVSTASPLFIGKPAVALVSGDLTFVLVENAVGEATLSVCLNATGGQWAANPEMPTSVSNNISVCQSLQLISRRTETPPTVVVSRASVVALQNGGIIGTASLSQRTITVKHLASQIVPGSAAARGSSPTITSTILECSQCSMGNATGTLSGLASSADLLTTRDTATASSFVPAFVADLQMTLRQDVHGTCRACILRATDSTGAVGSSPAFELRVLPVNQPPTFAVGGTTTAVAGGVQSTVRALAGSPTTIPNWLSSVAAGPAVESSQSVNILLAGQAVSSTLFLVPPRVVGTALSFTFAANAPANASAVYTVSARDDGGTDNGGIDESNTADLGNGAAAPLQLVLEVATRNVAPTFTLGGPVSASVSDGRVTVAGWLQQVANGARPLSEVTATVAVNDTSLFSTQPSVSVATGALTFEPAAAGVASVTVTLRNQGGTEFGGTDTSNRTATITIAAVPPVLVLDAVSPIALAARTGAYPALRIASRVEPAGATLSLSGCVPSAPFETITIVNDTAAVTLRPNASGVFECTWRLTVGNAAVTRTSVVTVEGQPLPPTGRLAATALHLTQPLTNNTVVSHGFIVGVARGSGGLYPVDSAPRPTLACNDSLAFYETPSLSPLNATGASDLSLPLHAAFAGHVSCEARVVDSVGELSLPFTVAVARTNKPPAVTVTRPFVDVTFAEASTITIGQVADDAASVAGLVATLTLVSSVPSGADLAVYFTATPRVLVGADGTLSVALAASYTKARFNMSLVAVDAEGAASARRFVTISIDGGTPPPATTAQPGSPVTYGRRHLSAALAGNIDDFSRAEFRHHVARVLTAYGTAATPEEVTILSLRAGSVVVDFTFTPTTQSSGAGSSSTAAEREAQLLNDFPLALQSGTPEATAFVSELSLRSIETAAPATTAAPTVAPGTGRAGDSGDAWYEQDWVAYVVIILLVLLLLAVVIGICLCIRNSKKPRDGRRDRKGAYVDHDAQSDADGEDPAASPIPPAHPTEEWYPVKSAPRRRPADDVWVEVDPTPQPPPPPERYLWRDEPSYTSRRAHAGSVHHQTFSYYGHHQQPSFAQPAVYRPGGRR